MQDLEFISCLRFSMQLLMAQSIFTLDFKKRERFVWRLFLGIFFYIFLAYGVFRLGHRLSNDNPAALIFYYGMLFLLSLGLMKFLFFISFEEALFAGVCGYATQHLTFAAVTVLRSLTGEVLAATGGDFRPFRVPKKVGATADFLIIRFLPYLLTDFLVYELVVKKNRGKGEIRRRDPKMLRLSALVMVTVIILSVLVDSRIFRENASILQNIFCRLYALVCCLFSVSVAYSISGQNRTERENELMGEMLQNLGKQQKMSQEAVNIINIKCHDLKYKLSKISKMDDVQDRRTYIEEVRNALTIYDNIYHSGNETLDLILMEKGLICSELGIRFSTMADGSALFDISGSDLYALMGNLLDNAIECVRKEEDLEKRIISLQITRKKSGCFLHLENFCGEEVLFDGGLPITTKSDTMFHGFGVRSIDYIVRKYGGSLRMKYQDHRFTTDILF